MLRFEVDNAALIEVRPSNVSSYKTGEAGLQFVEAVAPAGGFSAVMVETMTFDVEDVEREDSLRLSYVGAIMICVLSEI